MTINKLLKIFNLKLVRTSPSFEWMGSFYYFSLKEVDCKIVDSRGSQLPIQFENEEDARFVISVIREAIEP